MFLFSLRPLNENLKQLMDWRNPFPDLKYAPELSLYVLDKFTCTCEYLQEVNPNRLWIYISIPEGEGQFVPVIWRVRGDSLTLIQSLATLSFSPFPFLTFLFLFIFLNPSLW